MIVAKLNDTTFICKSSVNNVKYLIRFVKGIDHCQHYCCFASYCTKHGAFGSQKSMLKYFGLENTWCGELFNKLKTDTNQGLLRYFVKLEGGL